MHYLVTGGTGFIGSALLATWYEAGHQVTVLTRQAKADTRRCHYIQDLGVIPDDAHFDVVVNLAGASLAGARWSAAYKRDIVDSRTVTTHALVELLGRLKQPPEALLSASAIGYYGHQADQALGEEASPVPGFSQQLCQRWEEEALLAERLGVRVCRMRFGVVLDRDGGAMQEMARPFRFGVANWLGSGKQWLSWVHRDDVIAAILYLLEHRELSGAFNITAPEPVTSRGFCQVMKHYYRTFITAPVPAPVMRVLVGEMAEELLLNGQRVVPTALSNAGFEFLYPTLDSALAAITR